MLHLLHNVAMASIGNLLTKTFLQTSLPWSWYSLLLLASFGRYSFWRWYVTYLVIALVINPFQTQFFIDFWLKRKLSKSVSENTQNYLLLRPNLTPFLVFLHFHSLSATNQFTSTSLRTPRPWLETTILAEPLHDWSRGMTSDLNCTCRGFSLTQSICVITLFLYWNKKYSERFSFSETREFTSLINLNAITNSIIRC